MTGQLMAGSFAPQRLNRKDKNTMALPDFSMRQLLEAGAHFGHQSHRWNPKMSPFIYGTRNNIHILDLSQSVPMLSRALQAVSDTVARGGRVLFVGTKRQAQDAIADAAKRSAQYYVNSRWLGGMLTNWKTISANKEALAIKEAQRLGIPVAAIIDSNSDPDGITFPVPANDDAGRAIQLYCDLVARSAIDGISRASGDHGIDLGAAETPIVETAIDEPVAVEGQAQAFELLTGPRGAPDDFMKLSGMGPEIVQKLNDGGIFHFWQLAAMSPADVTKVDHDLKLAGRIESQGWVAQARDLADA